MVSINLMNTGDMAKVESIKTAIEGKTYLKFHVTVYPHQGEYVVNAETAHPCTKQVAYGTLIMLMADMIS